MADSPQVFQSPCRYLSALVPFLRSTARCRPLPPPPRARRNATHDISLPDTCLSGRQCFTSRSLCRQYVDAALDPPGALRMTRSRCGWAGSAARLRTTLPRCPPVDHLASLCVRCNVTHTTLIGGARSPSKIETRGHPIQEPARLGRERCKIAQHRSSSMPSCRSSLSLHRLADAALLCVRCNVTHTTLIGGARSPRPGGHPNAYTWAFDLQHSLSSSFL